MTSQYYDIIVYSPLGNREGHLKLDIEEERVQGRLDLLGYINSLQGRFGDDRHFTLSGFLKTATGDLACSISATIIEDELCAVAQTFRGLLRITGQRTEAFEGDLAYG